jgi:hypothetical protein
MLKLTSLSALLRDQASELIERLILLGAPVNNRQITKLSLALTSMINRQVRSPNLKDTNLGCFPRWLVLETGIVGNGLRQGIESNGFHSRRFSALSKNAEGEEQEIGCLSPRLKDANS